MAAQVVVEMTAQEADLFRAQQKIIAQQKQMNAGYGQGAREAQKLERAAKRIYEQTRTPAERHKRDLQEINRLHKAGKIDVDTYRRAVDRANVKLDETARVGRRAFGPESLANFAAYAAGFASVTIAASKLLNTLKEIDSRKDEAAQRAKDSARGLSSLLQLTDDPGVHRFLQDESKRIYQGGGFDSVDESANVVFSLQSVGQMRNIDLFADLKKYQIVDEVGVLASAVSSLMTTMGERETGSARALVGKAFGTGETAVGTVDQLLSAAAKSGGSARSLGLSDEEVLAALAVTSKAANSPDVGGTQLSSLLRSLDQSGQFQGRSLMGSVQAIDAMGLDAAGLQKLLGREEAVQALRALSLNQSLYQESLGNINAAQRTDTVGRRVQIAQGDPMLASAAASERATANLALLEMEKFAVRRNLTDAIQADRRASLESGEIKPQAMFRWAGDLGASLDSAYRESFSSFANAVSFGGHGIRVQLNAVRDQEVRDPALMAEVLRNLDQRMESRGGSLGDPNDRQTRALLEILDTTKQYQDAAALLVDSSNSLRDVTEAMKQQAQELSRQTQRVSDPHMHTE